jgi:hypothetical protein
MTEPNSLLPCPFCNVALVANNNQADLPVRRYGTHYLHPNNGCLLEGNELTPSEVAAWNRRAPAVPPNWKLVPDFPTPEMYEGFRSINCTNGGDGLDEFTRFRGDFGNWAACYSMMLAASPPPPEAASQPDSVNEGSAGEVK